MNSPTLRERKECVEMTLRYVENERRLLDAGVDCVGDTPYLKRAWLLDQLALWYRSELHDLDGELTSQSMGGNA